ncbi:winged helix-turn-helix transcriptional regulator [Labrys sp. KNU-23]|uniref:sugar-binding transcriptional regulator n=1 Tax=Labrys sp. KNU-23 TaxID=2789216 RepID=UPI0011EE7E87|nr:sugar-binding domain-containing protein [Labrys sp. KNU-23]QEN88623.1 winged helix-turn-helix transcriptional regulator [Labrys sp. KNU-23]
MVARLHYESDLSQVEIARRLGLSTATISRLLRRARDEGIVRIEIRDFTAPEDLTRELVKALGLRKAALVETSEVGLLASLAQPVGTLLKEAGLKDGSVLAIGWGRAIREVIRAGLPSMPGVITVPATGGMQQPAPHFQISEFVRLAAEQLGGTPQFIHAPYLPSQEYRDAFINDPTIRDQIALWDRIDAALVGVGLPHGVDPVHAGAATSSERALVQAAGDVIRHYFDEAGNLVPWEGDERLIAISPEQLRAIPLVIGVAVSPAKAKSIIGAVRARLINAVVTDTATAEAMLALLRG